MQSPIKYYGGKTYMTEIIKGNFPSEFKTPNAGSSATECLWRNYTVKNFDKAKEEQGLREFKWN